MLDIQIPLGATGEGGWHPRVALGSGGTGSRAQSGPCFAKISLIQTIRATARLPPGGRSSRQRGLGPQLPAPEGPWQGGALQIAWLPGAVAVLGGDDDHPSAPRTVHPAPAARAFLPRFLPPIHSPGVRAAQLLVHPVIGIPPLSLPPTTRLFSHAVSPAPQGHMPPLLLVSTLISHCTEFS